LLIRIKVSREYLPTGPSHDKDDPCKANDTVFTHNTSGLSLPSYASKLHTICFSQKKKFFLYRKLKKFNKSVF
jgi:hypothetical protein